MPRKTPPSFDFYPDDFVAGVADMTAEEAGAYLLLLCYQWGHGFVPNSDCKLQRITRLTGDNFVSAWETIRHKFVENGTGGLVNERMQLERDKALATIEARREAGRKGGSSKAKNLLQAKGVASASKGKREGGRGKREVGSKEDGAVASSKFVKPTLEEVTAYAAERDQLAYDPERFVDHYTANGWKVGRNPMKCWKAAWRNWVKTEQNGGFGKKSKPTDIKVSFTE